MGSIGAVEGYPDEESLLYSLDVVTAKGSELSLEEYAGYVTIVAIVPLLQGMAQFYYELLEHVQSIYPYTLQILLLPCAVISNEPEKKLKAVNIKPRDKPKVVLLKPMIGQSPLVDYFVKKVKIYTGWDDTKVFPDRVTMFIVSANGEFVERAVSPTLHELERRIGVYSMQLDTRYRFRL